MNLLADENKDYIASLDKLVGTSGTGFDKTSPDEFKMYAAGFRAALNSDRVAVNTGFRFERIGMVEPKAPVWLIRGILEADCIACLYGDPAAGKTFIAIEMAASVATGTAFYNHQVKRPGCVLYMAAEGRAGLARRFKAWSIARGISIANAPLYWNVGAFSLIDERAMEPVGKALTGLIAEIGQPPSLVILDTWSRTLGGDDSSPSDAAAGVAVLDDLRARFGGFAALIVHHEGHTKGRARGWTGLKGAVDVEFRGERGVDGILRLECGKVKDGPLVEPMAFQFATVDLGIIDEEGEAVTSAVLNRVDYEAAANAERPAGKRQSAALDILIGLYADYQENLSKSGADTGTARVTLKDWRNACLAADIPRQRFSDAKAALESRKQIILEDPFVILSASVSAVRGYYIPPGRTDTFGPSAIRKPDTNRTTGQTKEDELEIY